MRNATNIKKVKAIIMELTEVLESHDFFIDRLGRWALIQEDGKDELRIGKVITFPILNLYNNFREDSLELPAIVIPGEKHRNTISFEIEEVQGKPERYTSKTDVINLLCCALKQNGGFYEEIFCLAEKYDALSGVLRECSNKIIVKSSSSHHSGEAVMYVILLREGLCFVEYRSVEKLDCEYVDDEEDDDERYEDTTICNGYLYSLNTDFFTDVKYGSEIKGDRVRPLLESEKQIVQNLVSEVEFVYPED